MQDGDAVAEPEQLGEVGAGHQRRASVSNPGADPVVDLVARAHVDATGRLVQEEHPTFEFEQAREGRLEILATMEAALPAPREELPDAVPKTTVVVVPGDAVGKVIGPGGKMVRAIIEVSGAACVASVANVARAAIAWEPV